MADLSVLEFRAMGSSARVVVDGGPPTLAAQVRDLIWNLERLWSRFVDSSEVSAINRAPGSVSIVSAATYSLLNRAVRAQAATGGLFNPLMLDQLETHGYGHSWDDSEPIATGRPTRPATDEPIVLYPEINAVRLPRNSRFDPGGIGKGLAIDLASGLCLSSGAESSSVEIGGDLRVFGSPWYDSSWRIPIVSPFDPSANIATLTPTVGAVTTSSTKKRRWTAGGREYHHLLDPRTGHPSEADIAAVTTCSSEAWWSEVAAKTALIAGRDRAVSILGELGVPGIVVANDGTVLTTDDRARTSGDS